MGRCYGLILWEGYERIRPVYKSSEMHSRSFAGPIGLIRYLVKLV